MFFANDAAQWCDTIGQLPRYCAQPADGTAWTTCEPDTLAPFPLVPDGAPNIPCAGGADCLQAGGLCLQDTGGALVCQAYRGGCVTYCESSDGAESYGCPSGETCGLPSGYPPPPWADNWPWGRTTRRLPGDAACTSATACENAYLVPSDCVGGYCVSPRKVCFQ